jgi:hypothetical protein
MLSINFNTPFGILAFKKSPILVVGDSSYSVLYVISLINATVIAIVGGCNLAAHVNGVGTNARFNQPREILANSDEDAIFVNDVSNQVFRKITYPGLVVTTIAGIPGANLLVNGPLATASWTGNVVSFHVSVYGNVIYFGDGNVLRKIDFREATPSIVTIAGGSAGYRDGAWSVAQFNGVRGARQFSCVPPPNVTTTTALPTTTSTTATPDIPTTTEPDLPTTSSTTTTVAIPTTSTTTTPSIQTTSTITTTALNTLTTTQTLLTTIAITPEQIPEIVAEQSDRTVGYAMLTACVSLGFISIMWITLNDHDNCYSNG